MNSSALSFNPYKIPQEIEDQIPKRKFVTIIKSVNAIINSEYKNHKMGNSNRLKNAITYSEVIMYSLLSFIVIGMVILNPETGSNIQYWCLAAIFGVIVLGTLLAWK